MKIRDAHLGRAFADGRRVDVEPQPLFDLAPEGFRIQQDVLTAEEEQTYVRQFETLAFKPFDFHGYQGNRRVVSFGWRYDYGDRKLGQAEPIPDFLQPLKRIAAEFSGIDADEFVQALVTEYAPGAGIGWHRDKPMFRDVVALSFLSLCRLRLRRKLGTGWDRHTVALPPRSAYLLSGPARTAWEHSIPPQDALRYSVTFRNLVTDWPTSKPQVRRR